ncbi:MAG: hypothetical protein WA977_01360 [Halobacteriota archaeon]
MVRIRVKARSVEIEVEADEMRIAEETFAKIADGAATGAPTTGTLWCGGITDDKKLYSAISDALKKK